MSTAEELKELGNKAFSSQKFEEAIEHYTSAIKLDPKNHVFFSNRSASHASLKQYTEAIADAKQCIKLNLTFIKGYYRLASAQLQMDDLTGATTTCKQGLNVDPGNKQLEKLLRQAKARIATQKKMNASSSSRASSDAVGAGAGADSSELQDLKAQYRKSASDYNLVQTSIQHTAKTIQVNNITLQELETIPVDENRKMYSGLGKAFLMQTKDQVFDGLKAEIKEAEKKMEDMVQKKDYLERRMKSQRQNIIECGEGK